MYKRLGEVSDSKLTLNDTNTKPELFKDDIKRFFTRFRRQETAALRSTLYVF